MQVSSVSNTRTAATTADPQSATTPATIAKKSMLGQDDFLKLLAVQFQQQDPMKPMEDTAFIAQMAQFTALDQSSSMLTQIKSQTSMQEAATANSYLGKHVTVDDGNGGTISGDVSGVENASGTPRLVVGDYTFPISAVLLVEPIKTAPAVPTPTN